MYKLFIYLNLILEKTIIKTGECATLSTAICSCSFSIFLVTFFVLCMKSNRIIMVGEWNALMNFQEVGHPGAKANIYSF